MLDAVEIEALLNVVVVSHARIQTVLSEGVRLRQLFLVDEAREDPNTNIGGPSSARHGVFLACR